MIRPVETGARMLHVKSIRRNMEFVPIKLQFIGNKNKLH